MKTNLDFKVTRKVGDKYEPFLEQSSHLFVLTPEQLQHEADDVHAMVKALDPKKLPKAEPGDDFLLHLDGNATTDGGNKQTPDIKFIPEPINTTYEGLTTFQKHVMDWVTKKTDKKLAEKKAKAKAK